MKEKKNDIMENDNKRKSVAGKVFIFACDVMSLILYIECSKMYRSRWHSIKNLRNRLMRFRCVQIK